MKKVVNGGIVAAMLS